MSSTLPARIIASLRLVGVTVVLAAGIAGFVGTDSSTDAGSVQLDLAVVTSDGHS